MKAALKHLSVFLLWNLVTGGFILLAPPRFGLPAALALYAALLWGYLLRPSAGTSRSRKWATLRLRPLEGAALRWSLVAVPVVLLLSWALGDVYSRIVAIPPESLDPFGPIMTTPMGRLTIAIFAIGVAPIVEEFFFRGLIQRTLERKRGIPAGIVLAAALFAAVHLLPWVLPLHFFLGMAFGFAVYATRSIWTGVILHAANNSVALVGVALTEEEMAVQTIWEIGITADLWVSVLFLIVAIGLGAWTARKLLESGQQVGLPAA